MTTEGLDDEEAIAKPGESDDQAKARKRKERLEQNRISARESRKRKKTMIEELQRTVISLSRENKDLNERNESLRRQLMEIGAKYPNVVPLQAIVGQATAAAAPGGSSEVGNVAVATGSPDGGAAGGVEGMNWATAGGPAPGAAVADPMASDQQANV